VVRRPFITRIELRLVIKLALATGLSWLLGEVVIEGQSHPAFAALVPMIAMRVDPLDTLQAVAARAIGVVGGVTLGVVTMDFVGLDAAIVAIVILLALLIGAALRVGSELNKQFAISALIVFSFNAALAEDVGVTRIWETLIGTAVTLVFVLFVFPPDPVKELRAVRDQLWQALERDLKTTFGLAGGDKEKVYANLGRTRLDFSSAAAAMAKIEPISRSLRFNPFHRHDRDALTAIEGSLRHVDWLLRYTAAISRHLNDAVERGPGAEWGAANEDLAEAGKAAAEAAALAHRGESCEDAVDRARAALARFRAAAPDPDAHAIVHEGERLLDELAKPTHAGRAE
jgi:uncharacterized membrane protein YccC